MLTKNKSGIAFLFVLTFGWSNAFGDGFSGEKAAWEHYHKGVGYYMQAGKEEDSRKLYFQALGELSAADILLPGNFNFKFYLGKVYEALGRYPEAIAQYENVYEMAGKFENKELGLSIRSQATSGITACREKSGDRKGAVEATKRDLQGKSEDSSAAGYAKLADYALQTGNFAEAKGYMLKISSVGPLGTVLKQEWFWKCKTKFSEADCLLDPPKTALDKSRTEKVSFYLKGAVHGPGGLEFYAPSAGTLPVINKALHDCVSSGKYKRQECVSEVLSTIEKDIPITLDAGLKEWKRFLMGLVQYETDRFDDAMGTFGQVAASGADGRLCAAALHLQADIAGVLRQPEKELALLDELHARYPGYDKYPDEFRTYPLCFSRERHSCLEMPSISDIAANRALLEKMALLHKDISVSTEAVSSAVISSQTVLAGLYDAYCPSIWVYGHSCPDALKLYKKLHEIAPAAPDGDAVFLKIQESRFCYEYEGDDLARNQDIVANYGPFLEKYPQSPLVPDIRKKYDEAKAFLDNLPEPPRDQQGCSSY